MNSETEYLFKIVIFSPIVGCIFAYILGCIIGRNNKKLGGSAAGWIASCACLVSFVLSLYAYLTYFYVVTASPKGTGSELAGQFVNKILISLGKWFFIGKNSIDFAYVVDSLSIVFVLLITGVGAMIHLYSVSYMKEDDSQPRYFALLNLFIFSMLNLVLADNYVLLFAGWEGVGVCSYLLVGYRYSNLDYAKAAKKAFIVNRIGDAFFLAAIFLIATTNRTFSFSNEIFHGLFRITDQFAALSYLDSPYFLIAPFLFLACAAKSAQFPLFVWLPDAMAGPTPVSALIHAATMVTAGIYLTARIGGNLPLGAFDPNTQLVILSLCLLTAVIGAVSALCQQDIKKVLAYSTVSQLGLMMFSAALGFYHAAIFHVVTHAFFKATLFLAAGSVIHGCHNQQDMRRFGGLIKKMPVTATIYGLSVLAISGIYPLSGYFSKHDIFASLSKSELSTLTKLNPVYAANLSQYSGFFLNGLYAVSILTGFYMMRSFVLTFLGSYRGSDDPHEAPPLMLLPKIVLSVGVVVGGFIFEKPIFAIFNEQVHSGSGIYQALIGSWPGLLGVFGCLLLYFLFSSKLLFFEKKQLGILATISENSFGINELYQILFVKPYELLAGIVFNIIDKGIVSSAVNFCWISFVTAGEVLARQQNGILANYIIGMLLGVLTIILLFF
jgi:NADH-quinone oxidoreductase subunit L